MSHLAAVAISYCRGPRKASTPQAPEAGDKLSFNHVMLYVKDLQRALDFYRDLLGFKPVEEFRHEGRPVYCEIARA